VSPPKQPPRKSVTVEIAGERHVLRSDAPPEYTHAVAAHVDATIRALGPGTMLEPHRTAILTALVITDELFRAREELRALREELDRRAAVAADLLERAIGEEHGPGAPPSDAPA
jgi:cell division protein ZapA (FtsZ GTPase activity inhibitor)